MSEKFYENFHGLVVMCNLFARSLIEDIALRKFQTKFLSVLDNCRDHTFNLVFTPSRKFRKDSSGGYKNVHFFLLSDSIGKRLDY